jgi:cell division protein FtsB
MLGDILNKSNPVNQQKEMSKSEYKKLVDRNTELIDRLKEVKEEIRILESNCDISEYQAQKLYNLIDKGEDKK